MNRKPFLLLAVIALLLLGFFIYLRYGAVPDLAVKNESAAAQITEKGNADIITVSQPLSGSIIKSPLTVRGEARGNWYFEASFPVKLFDENGTQIAAVPAQAQGEWMTENFVPFIATLNFPVPTSTWGVLVLRKDNPSGLPEHDDALRIPVLFR